MRAVIFFLLVFLLWQCKFEKKVEQQSPDLVTEVVEFIDIFKESPPQKSEIVLKLEYFGLIDIHSIDTMIVVDLKYSTTDNFCGQILYEGLTNAYFQPEVATMLSNAQKYLQDTMSGAKLLIYDAARPLSVQKIMWEKVKNTQYKHYVAHPDNAGLHNYGAAVDLTIIDKNGIPLDMGTPFDYFGKAAGNLEKELINEGVLTSNQVQNRLLLRYVMKKSGFSAISGEWWHFNACSLSDASKKYEIID